MKDFKLSDFPGMANVCYLHAAEWYRDGSTKWREGGTNNCVCERANDALARLRGEAAWARQDETNARLRAEDLEAQVARLEAGS